MSSETVGLTIRSTIKKIDEMTFQSPLSWTVYQLKMFIALNHAQGSDYFKPEKTHLYYGGKLLENNTSLSKLFKNKDLKKNYTLISKFNAGADSEQTAEAVADETERENILEDYSRLFSENTIRKQNTNMNNIELMTGLPVLLDGISKQLAKGHVQKEKTEDTTAANENEQDQDVEFPYVIKLAIRIIIIFLLFRTHLHGVFLYAFIGILVVYFLIKLSQKNMRQRNQQRQQQQQQILQIINAVQQQGAVQGGNQPGIPQPQIQIQNEYAVKPSFFNKVKELLLCFFSSLYPSWDMNLYIDNHPVAQPENEVTNPHQGAITNSENVDSNKNAGQDGEEIKQNFQAGEIKEEKTKNKEENERLLEEERNENKDNNQNRFENEIIEENEVV